MQLQATAGGATANHEPIPMVMATKNARMVRSGMAQGRSADPVCSGAGHPSLGLRRMHGMSHPAPSAGGGLVPHRPSAATLAAGAGSGVLAAAVAVSVGHFAAAILDPSASPFLAVGAALIDVAPQPLKAFAIATFGDADKVILLAGIAVVMALAAGTVGIAGLTRPRVAAAAIGAFGMVGAAAAIARPTAAPTAVIPAILGAAIAIAVLLTLHRALTPRAAPVESRALQPGRRRFLATAGLVGLATAVSGGMGLLLGRARAQVGAVEVPVPMDPAPEVPPSVQLETQGIAPFYTPNDRFYRVDTALEIPIVDPRTWSLRVHGMVEREVTLTLDELLQLPTIERDITLACVSNQVGGPYVGNARWIGIPLGTVLELAGVHTGADQIVSRSIDGMTIGTPTAVALDGRDSMLAVGMNGEPLPAANGFPVRMLVPGLYGYVSATKWLVDIELTTFAAYDPYWVQRGWAEQAPIKTMSRIDTPKPLATLAAGDVTLGGVAWAQHRGIEAVEVRVDDGPWTAARLAAVDSIDTWRQWTLDAPLSPGRHTLQVRAKDGDGLIQPEARAEPFPDGATGWHSIVVTVT
jgi:DMSO/TMAO reductase YedYZ molybdopterin-dependent catalytic subunit